MASMKYARVRKLVLTEVVSNDMKLLLIPLTIYHRKKNSAARCVEQQFELVKTVTIYMYRSFVTDINMLLVSQIYY